MSFGSSQDYSTYKKMVEKSVSHNDVPFTGGRFTTKSSPRFGTLSHHSFFSRHNPHPHRVTHIQGLNGKPVCMVNDDWCVTTSLFPHPLIKSQVFRTGEGSPFGLPLGHSLYGGNSMKYRAALLSEAWKEELKELAAKVSMSSQMKGDKREQQPGELPVRRKTQYSAQTGRIIPPPTQAYQRRSHPQAYTPLHHLQPQAYTPLYDQELMVLELLCQILQTDSLSLVQQWLLLAGQREKDMVMGLIQQAMEDSDLLSHQQRLCRDQGPLSGMNAQIPTSLPKRRQRFPSSQKMLPLSSEDKPEWIGEAEVLEVHPENQHAPREDPLQSDEND